MTLSDIESELRGGILISFAYMKNEPNLHPKSMIFASKKQSPAVRSVETSLRSSQQSTASTGTQVTS